MAGATNEGTNTFDGDGPGSAPCVDALEHGVAAINEPAFADAGVTASRTSLRIAAQDSHRDDLEEALLSTGANGKSMRSEHQPTPLNTTTQNSSLTEAETVPTAAEADVGSQKKIWLIVRVASRIVRVCRMTILWTVTAIRLLCFVTCLLPAFLRVLVFYLCDKHVHRSISYGTAKRNFLDAYTVPTAVTSSPDPAPPPRLHPVVVFFSGGAWIIGYKAWGALMGRVFSRCGIVFVTPDYRNYPQGVVTDMLVDADSAMTWVMANIAQFGGDASRVTLMGQSAGAHLAACLLLDSTVREAKWCSTQKDERQYREAEHLSKENHADVESKAGELAWTASADDGGESKIITTVNITEFSALGQALLIPADEYVPWRPSDLHAFVGISGPYDLRSAIAHFQSRGLDESVFSHMMRDDLDLYSPTLRMQTAEMRDPNVIACFPPHVALFHGTDDATVPVGMTRALATALVSAGVTHTKARYYDHKSHTDPILEDPIAGSDPLAADLLRLILLEDKENDEVVGGAGGGDGQALAAIAAQPGPMQPRWTVAVARWVNPF